MRRGAAGRLLAGLLAGVLLPAGLAGCGIPDRTEVQVDGPGPAAESGSLNGSGAQPPGPTASSDPKDFIRNYLSAAAGEREQAYARAKQFLAPEARNLLRDKQQSSEIRLTVVRLREDPEARLLTNEGIWLVTVRVQQVGVLRADGTLDAPVANDDKYVFRLRPADAAGQGLWITELPNLLLLSDNALHDYYTTHTIYFWNADQTRLVPDLRYLPRAVPAERRVTEVVKWLTSGPPEWLAQGVTRLPDGTALINNATATDGRWEVNLTMPAANDEQLSKLGTQLALSLPELAGQLDLKIQNQKRRTVDLRQERLDHPLHPGLATPEPFCVYDGAIHRLNVVGERGDSEVPLNPAKNRNVVTATLSRAGDQVLAAMVVTRPDKRQQLVVGTGPGTVVVLNGSGWYGSVSRPTWLRSTDPAHPYGLVAADGRLYGFDGGAALTELAVPGKVTAVAASLDGHRAALIINGALFVVAVSVDGGGITLGKRRQLSTRLTALTAVDWYGENQLVYSGSEVVSGSEARRPAIYQSTVDGAGEGRLRPDTNATVTHLAAFPGDASRQLPAAYMYQATRSYWNNPLVEIKTPDVLGVAAGAKPSDPSAPFFLY